MLLKITTGLINSGKTMKNWFSHSSGYFHSVAHGYFHSYSNNIASMSHRFHDAML